MNVIVRLVIFSVNMTQSNNDSIYICTKEDKIVPSKELASNQEVIDCAKQILQETCGVQCCNHEFITSNDYIVSDDTLVITYGVIIPYNVNNNHTNNYTLVNASKLIESGDIDERSSGIIRGLLYKV